MIETLSEFNEVSERERQLKEHLAALRKIHADVLGDLLLTLDDKTCLAPGDAISQAVYILSTLKCDLDDYADRAECAA